jgi:cytoplasmic iron level regulating protein YaaA (DUF328/UPF0246 family)|tara:strand:+ start:5789 stop:6484 length:696 start_codon:yes stop_codon:yes gene_type:complete
MKFLIPPSEGKSKVISQDVIFADTNFQFEHHVNQVVRLLGLIEDENLSSVYGTSEEKAMAFHRQNQDIFNSKCAYAIERYTGVVYEHLNWESLDEKAQNFLDDHIYIFSGLFGMVTPRTLIPDYKLKMNVLSLQYHWSPIISEQLEKEDLIIDLLPQVHRKAYNKGNNVITIDFQVVKKGKKSAAGHFGKAVKGQLIRYIAENQITNIDDFSGFEYSGFKWDGAAFVKEDN